MASLEGGKMESSSSREIEDLRQFAREVILLGGEKALSYYGKGDPTVKFDEGLVTEAELHLTEFFQEELSARFPDHAIFANDQEKKGYTHGGKRYLWVYDALDGVANFQAGIPIWGISLALMENFWPVFGSFYMPVTGDHFHAQAGGKSFWGSKEIAVSAQENIDDESLLFTYSRFHQDYHSEFPGKMRDLGCTSAHICFVATGRAEAAVISNEAYQDLAAVSIILGAAGGKFYKMDGNAFSLNEFLDGKGIGNHLLVTAPDVYHQVRGCLKEIR